MTLPQIKLQEYKKGYNKGYSTAEKKTLKGVYDYIANYIAASGYSPSNIEYPKMKDIITLLHTFMKVK